ncbi:hypothetical protein AGMMS50212_08750 [Spirochaetia bacterium]|nr:hypothetical protein AGMMS50212_08750 [Spirochaetia bacterium]
MECGLKKISGFDINPLAILISKVKYTPLSLDKLEEEKQILRNNIFEFLKNEKKIQTLEKPVITNIDFWFSKETISNLSIIKHFINQIENIDTRNFFLLPFSETVRDCSYTRNNEFKLYRMKEEDVLNFNPDVIGVYFKYLNDIYAYYKNFYLPKLSKNVKANFQNNTFQAKNEYYDIVLTSPPYGDSRTTVAYGQFSTLSNERALSNKSMPSRNSPTNKTGKTVNTMLYEYIVVCENLVA